MKFINKYIMTIMLVLSASMIISSCSSKENEPEAPAPVEKVNPIGKYTMDGKDVDIMRGYWTENDYYYILFFTPLNVDVEKATTKVTIAVAKALTERALIIDNINHNYDYIFEFEDPTRLYSKYRKLDGGDLYLSKTKDDIFDLSLNTKLIDGTPFVINYKGKLTPITKVE